MQGSETGGRLGNARILKHQSADCTNLDASKSADETLKNQNSRLAVIRDRIDSGAEERVGRQHKGMVRGPQVLIQEPPTCQDIIRDVLILPGDRTGKMPQPPSHCKTDAKGRQDDADVLRTIPIMLTPQGIFHRFRKNLSLEINWVSQ